MQKGSIFVVGGDIEGQDCSRRVSEFVVNEARWRERAPLAIGRYDHAAAVLKAGTQTLLGVFGGVRASSSCEVYDVRRGRWHHLPRMREERTWGSAAASLPTDCRVFVFGGGNFSSSCRRLDSVEFCSLGVDWQEAAAARTTAGDFWQTAAPMRRARKGLAAIGFRGRFIVAGGQDEDYCVLNGVDLFSPPDASSPRGLWTALADIGQPRQYFTLLASGDAVFALSGLDNNTVEEFTGAAASKEADCDLTSWHWSFRNPVKLLYSIRGAALIHQQMSPFCDYCRL